MFRQFSIIRGSEIVSEFTHLRHQSTVSVHHPLFHQRFIVYFSERDRAEKKEKEERDRADKKAKEEQERLDRLEKDRLDREERAERRELEKLQAEAAKSKTATPSKPDVNTMRQPRMPLLMESRDQLDSYLARFEMQAKVNKWPVVHVSLKRIDRPWKFCKHCHRTNAPTDI
ncbi:hypothetical protein PoB_001405200 [Plakobranchus ocellatus]|uniref:Uncharacterized protein n=1 Tax=Plakobranchus ocellatus TaxID=259542 RepID=A0AAV3YZB2_9GAST|nr:hypothetical protein PoB_001405200 [Plakobranchus ocellatus]